MSISNEINDILIYQTEDGITKIEVAFTGDTIWLSQDQIGKLFQTTRTNINMHIKNIFEDGELEENEVMTKVSNPDFSRQRPTQVYNLQMILAIGYRVRSRRGIHFRKWATNILEEYMKKGFTMNDEVLKNAGGGVYFKELLDRIRDIRSSEKIFYRQVLDLFATSIDYDPKSEIAIEFFKVIQNKLHFATHEHTAAELIAKRANAELPFMGLHSFKGIRPQKSEVANAKNYLTEKEIKSLNLMVSAYLEIAEMKAHEQEVMYMSDWVRELENFIVYRKKPLLTTAGKISEKTAKQRAFNEYEKYIEKNSDELTQVEKDFIDTIIETYELLEKKSHSSKNNK